MNTKKINLLVLLTFFVIGYSCNDNKPTTKETSIEETSIVETCIYNYDKTKTKASWTAYKTTEKLGVSGSFDTVIITETQESESIKDVFLEAKFVIPINTINSKNEVRDKKIIEYFFGSLVNTSQITGKLLSIKDDSTAEISIIINNITNNVLATYTIKDEEIKLKGEIDLKDWQAQNGIDALNKVCEDLHKGNDGLSKLWPNVVFEITSVLIKECP